MMILILIAIIIFAGYIFCSNAKSGFGNLIAAVVSSMLFVISLVTLIGLTIFN